MNDAARGQDRPAIQLAPPAAVPKTRFGRRYRYLLGTFALASSGDGFSYGAVPLLAVVVDPRPLAVSAVIAADSLPWLLLALPAGSFADRLERGRVMAIVNASRGLLLAAMATLVAFRSMGLALLILFVVANGSARAVYYSAAQAALPELVPAAALGRANGQWTGTESATEHLAGPILGALAFGVARALPFVADASVVGASGLALFRLRTKRRPSHLVEGSTLDGLRRLWSDHRLRVLVCLVAALSGLQGLVAGVLVLVATRDWGVHAELYGVFVAAGAAGNIPGALVADRLRVRLGSAPLLLCAAVVSGIAYVVMAVAHTWLLAGAAFALVGFAVAAGSVVAISLRQLLTPAELMGRVGSAWRGIVWGAAPVGALAAGVLALLGGLRLPLIAAGVAQCVIAASLARPLIRNLRGLEPAAAAASVAAGEIPPGVLPVPGAPHANGVARATATEQSNGVAPAAAGGQSNRAALATATEQPHGVAPAGAEGQSNGVAPATATEQPHGVAPAGAEGQSNGVALATATEQPHGVAPAGAEGQSNGVAPVIRRAPPLP